MKLPRELDPVEIRVLGCLLEKEQTTPDAYPLSLNALLAACNQRSNRDPVMELTEGDVRGALDRMHADVLVWPVEGARVERWRHNLDRRWQLEPQTKTIMTLLLLRGAQTAGELRGRSGRMHPFGSPDEVEELLERLAADDEPLTVKLARQPGQKGERWMHLVGGRPAELPTTTRSEPPPVEPGPSLRERVSELEDRVERLERALGRLSD